MCVCVCVCWLICCCCPCTHPHRCGRTHEEESVCVTNLLRPAVLFSSCKKLALLPLMMMMIALTHNHPLCRLPFFLFSFGFFLSLFPLFFLSFAICFLFLYAMDVDRTNFLTSLLRLCSSLLLSSRVEEPPLPPFSLFFFFFLLISLFSFLVFLLRSSLFSVFVGAVLTFTFSVRADAPPVEFHLSLPLAVWSGWVLSLSAREK